MVSWSSVWTAVSEFLKDYFILLVLAGIVIIYILVKKIIKQRKLNKEQDKLETQELDLEALKMKEDLPPYDGDEHEELKEDKELDFFMAEQKKPEEEVEEVKDIHEEIKQLSNSINEDSDEMDSDMSEEFNKLKKQLKEINNKKVQVKKYGEGLVKLYKKYDQREKHITAMMMGLEKLMKK